jgi:hypothetical protein
VPEDCCLILDYALCGLKQAGNKYSSHRDDILTRLLGYTQSIIDPCLFFKFSSAPTGEPLYFDVATWWVDDSTQGIDKHPMYPSRINSVINNIAALLPIINKGIPTSNVGASIVWNPVKGTLFVNQAGHIDEVIAAARLQDSNRQVLTPLRYANTGDPHPGFQGVSFNTLTRILNFIACYTRPDISYAV